ncbi:MAG: ATP-binding protein [Candidatus Obscuribacterales bacterium]
MPSTSRSKPKNQLLKTASIYFAVAMLIGLCLEVTGTLQRAELQSINHRYEVRPWFLWDRESLNRLNPTALWDYHEAHEIPRHWWAWDYTLSWLIENNHPPVKQNIIIFNHLLEDEPPLEAVKDNPWMAPLTRQPMSRGTVAEMVRFLARAGAKQIILDNDFPGFTAEDDKLASVIYKATSGQLTGKKVPVLMARTISHRSSGQLLQLHQQPAMSGVLRELQKLDPKADVFDKYTGTTAALVDDDLVVRRMAATLPSPSSEDTQSLVLKSLELQGIPAHGVPTVFDIDFASPPNSELYPVRPISYLLDPAARTSMTSAKTKDVKLKDAVVIIGDGVTDLMSTPHTNTGVNLMSGSEVLAHAMDTVARRSWHDRMYRLHAFPFLFFITLLATVLHFSVRSGMQRVTSPIVLSSPVGRFLPDGTAYVFTVGAVYLVSCVVFAQLNLIVPLVPVIVGLTLATLSATLFEREEERTAHMQQQLLAARQKFESDLKLQESEARNREAELDKERRRDFAKRINHDLKAPVSVLNWTLSRLRQDGLEAKGAPEKIERLERTTDRLFRLIGELVKAYDYSDKRTPQVEETCDLRELIFGSIDVQSALAEVRRSRINLDVPDEPMLAIGSSTDIARIIDNLMRNALIHNPHGTSLTVTAKTEHEEHIISVSDNGRGIAADRLPLLFEAGMRGDTDDVTGSGLGLSIVKQLAEGNGAQIFADSKVGGGTTFILHFKRAPEEKPAALPIPIPFLRRQAEAAAAAAAPPVAPVFTPEPAPAAPVAPVAPAPSTVAADAAAAAAAEAAKEANYVLQRATGVVPLLTSLINEPAGSILVPDIQLQPTAADTSTDLKSQLDAIPTPGSSNGNTAAQTSAPPAPPVPAEPIAPAAPPVPPVETPAAPTAVSDLATDLKAQLDAIPTPRTSSNGAEPYHDSVMIGNEVTVEVSLLANRFGTGEQLTRTNGDHGSTDIDEEEMDMETEATDQSEPGESGSGSEGGEQSAVNMMEAPSLKNSLLKKRKASLA